MAGVFDRMIGRVRIELSGAWVEGLINAAAREGIELWDVERKDGCTLCMSIYEPDLERMEQLAEKAMCNIEKAELWGGSKDRARLKRRSGLAAMLLICLLGLWISSFFVWLIDVQGNEKLSRAQVLRALADCGVDLGTARWSIDQDMVRSQMLLALPELAWMTVNVNGSKAVALVVERIARPEIYAESGPADLVAGCDAVIRRMNVEQGRAVVAPGSAVLEGELLVSGTMDSLVGGSRYLRSKGEVIADTWQELSAIAPADHAIKLPNSLSRQRFALKIGKKRIDLCFHSRKTIDGCDIIIHEYDLGAEGLFALPVRIVREELRGYSQVQGGSPKPEEMRSLLEGYSQLHGRGRLLSRSFSQGESNGRYVLTMRSHCLEDIAKTCPR